MSPIYEEHRSTRYEPPVIDLKNKNSSQVLLIELTGRNKDVLEVGTSTGYVSRVLKERGNTVTGIEIDPEAGEIAGQHCDSMIVGDIEKLDLDAYLAPSSFDVIIFGDVLEHLASPEDVLRKVKKYLRPDGYLAVSLPNVCHGDVILNLLMGDFKYTSMGLLDATHLRFFGLRNIIDLFSRCGYSITGLHTTVFPVGGTEQRLDPGVVPEDLANFVKSLPNSSVYQYIFKASPSPTPEAVEAVPAPDLDGLFRGAIEGSIQAEIKPLLEELSAYEVRTVSLAEQVEQLTEETQSLQVTISERDAQIASLDGQVEQLTGETQSLQVTISGRDGQIASLNEQTRQQAIQLMQLSNELASMKQSVVWRLLMKFHNGFVERALPQNTRRRRLYDLGLVGLRVLIHEGPRGLRIRGEKKLRGESPSRLLQSSKSSIAMDKNNKYQLIPGTTDYVYIPPRCPNNINSIIESMAYKPHFSIVVPVYNTPPDLLNKAVRSLQLQWYPHWELILVDDASPSKETKRCLSKINDPNIKVFTHPQNKGISGATNTAISHSTGDYVVLLDHDDELTEDCLFELALCINRDDPDYIYSDEDKIDEKGYFTEPHYKPDWSPDTMMSTMYVCHVSCIKKSLLEEVGGLRSDYDGCQDWDLILRIVEKTDRISHIPKVLYHWRIIPGSTSADIGAKSYVLDASRRVREDALKRRGLLGTVEPLEQVNGYFRVNYHLVDKPLISIIIPTRDHGDVLRRCIESIFKKSTYKNFELIVLDNGSVDSATLEYLEEIKAEPNISVIRHAEPFNYSELNNVGADFAKGEILLFLNDDTEVVTSDWLERMGGYAQLAHIGAVGAKLLYPGGKKIQHAGVLNLQDGPGHAFLHQNADLPGYYLRNLIEYNWLAVTGACLMIERKKFQSVNGFDVNYPIAYNDVDLCFRLRDAGFYNLVSQSVRLIHHESLTRRMDHADHDKTERLKQDMRRLYQKHPFYYQYDPFYSINLHPNGINFETFR
ncbi:MULTISPECIES: glycosyltransferase [Methanoculleus]|uniref:Glycosyl transferase, family 2 n=2 Tax=Methanoculleus TaxID=45989 RepID=A3CRX6_METMJ|nr:MULTISPECIES: glycosyltransferase [Methanoculleus]ABN56126.1 glycosyl transferase, family 2 [Methanoculleus marisnigri JR1]UYU17601.1 glycosyltransferase [Methanoculleus submarinus]